MEELSRDSNTTEYLGHCGLGFADLGCTESEVREARVKLTETQEREQALLEHLLSDNLRWNQDDQLDAASDSSKVGAICE